MIFSHSRRFKIKNNRNFWEISSELRLFANLQDNMKAARSIKNPMDILRWEKKNQSKRFKFLDCLHGVCTGPTPSSFLRQGCIAIQICIQCGSRYQVCRIFLEYLVYLNLTTPFSTWNNMYAKIYGWLNSYCLLVFYKLYTVGISSSTPSK